ncbi:MAG: hypothetical protein BroJett040_02310 [Oligoflexia bacterium]|nr:MAG: hypothetical protein BroJett040_02310 [Oligoflexia bacterium]
MSASSNKQNLIDEVTQLRHDVDHIDESIGLLLTQRHHLAQEIIKRKKTLGLSTFDPNREEEIILRLQEKFPDIPTEVLLDIYSRIFEWTKSSQS